MASKAAVEDSHAGVEGSGAHTIDGGIGTGSAEKNDHGGVPGNVSYQNDKAFYSNQHYLEQIIHRSANCIIVAGTHKQKEFIDPVSNQQFLPSNSLTSFCPFYSISRSCEGTMPPRTSPTSLSVFPRTFYPLSKDSRTRSNTLRK